MKSVFLFVCVIIIGCKNTDTKKIKNDWDQLGIKGKVQTVRIKAYADEHGNISSNPANYRSSQVVEFNDKGYITQVVSNSDADNLTKMIFSYDSINRKTKVEIFEKGSLSGSINYKYDDQDNLLEIESNPKGYIGTTIKYEYSNKGIRISKAVLSSDGSIYQLKKYDSKGNVIEWMEKSGSGDNISNSHFLYKYDDKNFVIEETTLDKNEIIIKTVAFSPNDKKISRFNNEREYDAGSINYTIYQKFEKLGKCGAEITDTIEVEDGAPKKEIKVLKECDKNDNWIKLSLPDQSGILKVNYERDIAYFN